MLGLYMMKQCLAVEAADQKDVKPPEESRRQLEGVGWQEGTVTCETGCHLAPHPYLAPLHIGHHRTLGKPAADHSCIPVCVHGHRVSARQCGQLDGHCHTHDHRMQLSLQWLCSHTPLGEAVLATYQARACVPSCGLSFLLQPGFVTIARGGCTCKRLSNYQFAHTGEGGTRWSPWLGISR